MFRGIHFAGLHGLFVFRRKHENIFEFELGVLLGGHRGESRDPFVCTMCFLLCGAVASL